MDLVSVSRGAGGLGLIVSPQNVVLELTAGGSAAEDGQLRIGDIILSVDGVPLAGRRLRELLVELPRLAVHSFVVRRGEEASAPTPPTEGLPPTAAPAPMWDDDDGPAPAAADPLTGVPTVFLAPTGTRFKTFLDVSRLERCSELCALAAAKWQECTGVLLRVSPRVECASGAPAAEHTLSHAQVAPRPPPCTATHTPPVLTLCLPSARPDNYLDNYHTPP